MMYSPGSMGERRAPDVDRLEKQVEELERLTDSLGEAPDEEVVAVLGRAVELLREINTGIESGLSAAQQGTQDVSALLERVNLGPFDEALEEIETRGQSHEQSRERGGESGA